MTKTLTEQWRNGKLPQGFYYIRWSFNIDDEPSYIIDYFDTEWYVGGAFINKERKFIDEVMCAVPSYDEIKRLQERLAIATKALKEYADKDKWSYCSEDIDYFYSTEPGYCNAEKALKEMDGVK